MSSTLGAPVGRLGDGNLVWFRIFMGTPDGAVELGIRVWEDIGDVSKFIGHSRPPVESLHSNWFHVKGCRQRWATGKIYRGRTAEALPLTGLEQDSPHCSENMRSRKTRTPLRRRALALTRRIRLAHACTRLHQHGTARRLSVFCPCSRDKTRQKEQSTVDRSPRFCLGLVGCPCVAYLRKSHS